MKEQTFFLTFGKIGACLHQLLNLRNEKFVCRLRSVNTHGQQKRDLSNAEMENFDEIVQSYGSHNRQWRSAKRMKRQLCMSKNWIYSWTMKSHRKTRQQYYRSEKLCDEKRVFLRMDQWSKKPHLIKDGIRIICNTEKLRSYCGFQACQVRPLDPHLL